MTDCPTPIWLNCICLFYLRWLLMLVSISTICSICFRKKICQFWTKHSHSSQTNSQQKKTKENHQFIEAFRFATLFLFTFSRTFEPIDSWSFITNTCVYLWLQRKEQQQQEANMSAWMCVQHHCLARISFSLEQSRQSVDRKSKHRAYRILFSFFVCYAFSFFILV